MVAPARRMSPEEFLRLPEEKLYRKYEDGVVTPKMSPKHERSTLQFELARIIDAILRRASIGRV